MRVRFRAGDPWPSIEIRKRLERRLRITVGRRSPSLVDIEVSLSFDPVQGGAEQPATLACRLRTRFRAGANLVLDERGSDLEAVLDVLEWRLGRSLERRHRAKGAFGIERR